MNQVQERLSVYIISMMSLSYLGYKSVLVIIPLWFISKERIIVLIAVSFGVFNLQVLKPDMGYQYISTDISKPLSSGTIVQTAMGDIYWPGSSEYLGCKVDMKGIVYPPKSSANPGGFDMKKWLFRYKIYAVIKPNYIRKIECRPQYALRYRRYLHQKFINLDLQFIPEIESLIWGNSSHKNHYWYEMGIVHFLSISGLHISGLYNITYRFLEKFIAKKLSQKISWLMVFCYVCLIGFPFCATRALMMLSFSLLKFGRFDSILITLACMLSLDPLSVWDIGAWYSFLAVSILSIGEDPIYYLSLGLSLVSFGFGLSIQPLSLLANYILAPYFMYGIFPLMLMGLFIPFLFSYCFIVVDRIFTFCLEILYKLSSFHMAPIILSWDKAISIIILMALRYWFLSPLWLPISLLLKWPQKSINWGKFSLSVLSVGHGLSVVISTQHHHLLYDIGSSHIPDVTHQVLLPYLNKKGVFHLDAVVISHPDYDHYGGLENLLRDRAVGKLWVSIPVTSSIKQDLCQAPRQFEWDGVIFRFLHPEQGDLYKGNNQSCVLQIIGQKGSVLLTGDIEKRVEKKLLAYGDQLQSTILIAPHHGSHTSLHDEFMNAVSPHLVIISESKRKRLKRKDTHQWRYPFFTMIL